MGKKSVSEGEKWKRERLVVFSSFSAPPAPHLLQVIFFKATRFLTEIHPDTCQPPLLISRIRIWVTLTGNPTKPHSVLVQDAMRPLAALDVSSHRMPLLSALVVPSTLPTRSQNLPLPLVLRPSASDQV